LRVLGGTGEIFRKSISAGSGLCRKFEGSRPRLVFRSAGEFFQEHRISWVAVRVLESRPRSLIKIVARKRRHICKSREELGNNLGNKCFRTRAPTPENNYPTMNGPRNGLCHQTPSLGGDGAICLDGSHGLQILVSLLQKAIARFVRIVNFAPPHCSSKHPARACSTSVN